MADRRAKRAYHHGDLAAALVDASIRILRDEGLEGLTLRSAARSVGVSHAAPKNHFGDLRGLLAAVAVRGFGGLRDELAAARRERSPAEALVASGVAYVRFATRSPGELRAMFHPLLADRAVTPELAAASRAAFQELYGAVEVAQREGAVAPGDTLGKSLAAWSLVHGLACLSVDGQLAGKGIAAEPAELAALVSRYLLDGVAPKATPHPRSPKKMQST